MQKMSVNAVVFSPTELINEVKIRPKLYDSELAADRSVKLELWREVCAALFDDWESCNKAMAYDRVLQIQKKWRSLRDAYNREVRLRKAGDRSRRVYLHFKRMSFLGGFEGTISSEDDENAGEERESYLIHGDDAPQDDSEGEPKRKSKKKKRKRQQQSLIDIQQPEEMEMPMFPVELTETDTDDSDRYFLLSFLPEMKQLPINIKMWARAQIANVMQEAVSSHFNGNTKMPPPNEKPNEYSSLE